jgi:hypothetical protein
MAIQFFTVTGSLRAYSVDYIDSGMAPDLQLVTATIEFIPRIPRGELLYAPGLTPPQAIILPPIKARFDGDGALHTVVGDLGVQLVANTAEIDMDQLIYDIRWSNVNYHTMPDDNALISAWAFEAPKTGGITVDLSQLDRLPPKEGL